MRRLRSLDARQSVLWNICAILEDELMRAKVGWEMLWVHAFDRFIGEYATTHACLFPYASDKILYARYSLKQQRKVWSGLLGLKSMARNPYGLLVAYSKYLSKRSRSTSLPISSCIFFSWFWSLSLKRHKSVQFSRMGRGSPPTAQYVCTSMAIDNPRPSATCGASCTRDVLPADQSQLDTTAMQQVTARLAR